MAFKVDLGSSLSSDAHAETVLQFHWSVEPGKDQRHCNLDNVFSTSRESNTLNDFVSFCDAPGICEVDA